MNLAVLHGLTFNQMLQADPTRTAMLRARFVSNAKARFNALARVIRVSIVANDCFGLGSDNVLRLMSGQPPVRTLTPAPRKAFAFTRTSDKVDAFMSWLNEREAEGILEITRQTSMAGRAAVEKAWSSYYIQSAYQKGIERGRQELRAAGYDVPEYGLPGQDPITAAFNQPFHVDRLGAAYTRTFEGLKGIDAAMDAAISRTLAEGLAQGLNPRTIARNLVQNDVLKIGRNRAVVLARTEVIRAHHVANMTEYEQAGVEGVNIILEIRTAGDNRVCERCETMFEGRTYPLDRAYGLIPLHPQCRCVAIPAKTSLKSATPSGKAGKSTAEPKPKKTRAPRKPKELKWKRIDNVSVLEEMNRQESLRSIGIQDFHVGYWESADPQDFLWRVNEICEDQTRIVNKYPGIRKLISKKARTAEQKARGLGRGSVVRARLYEEARIPGTNNVIGRYHSKSGATAPKAAVARMKRETPDLDKYVGRSWNAAGTSNISVWRHEYGHHVYYTMPKASQREWNKLYRTVGKKRIKSEISTYAVTNTREFFAEAYSVYVHPEYIEGAHLPQEVHEFFAKEFGA